MKANRLPKYWVVKDDGSQLFKDTVIKYLNLLSGNSSVTWIGNSQNYYYGYDGNKNYNGTDKWYGINNFDNNPMVLTLDEFIELSKEGYRFKDMVDGEIIIENDNNKLMKNLLNKFKFSDRDNWHGTSTYFFNIPGEQGKSSISHWSYFGDRPIIKVSELLDVKQNKNMEKIEITRALLKDIYGIACPEWKSKILNLASRTPLEDKIALSQDEVDEMFKASTKEQLPVLESIFGKQKHKDIDLFSGGVDDFILYGDNSNSMIRIRNTGEFYGKGFFLNTEFNWELVKDSVGQNVLVPSRK